MERVLGYAPLLAEGAAVTVALALLSLILATALGAFGAAAMIRGGVAGGAAAVYTTIVRGVPDLVMLLLLFFGGQRLINTIARAADVEPIDVSQFGAGVVTIGFIYGAYLTETFRGAYLAVPRGQGEAADALGLGSWAKLTRVLGPQVLRAALPGYSNVWQVLVKSTAVVSVIGLQDLVGLADKAGKATREPFLFFAVVLAVYLAITSASGWGLRALRARLDRGMAT